MLDLLLPGAFLIPGVHFPDNKYGPQKKNTLKRLIIKLQLLRASIVGGKPIPRTHHILYDTCRANVTSCGRDAPEQRQGLEMPYNAETCRAMCAAPSTLVQEYIFDVTTTAVFSEGYIPMAQSPKKRTP